MKLGRLAATLAVAVSATFAAPAIASARPDSSPYGCWGWFGSEAVCYQIVGASNYVDYMRGQATNNGPGPVAVAVRVTGPFGYYFTWTAYTPAHATSYWQWNLYRGVPVGPWCATYISSGHPNLVRCWNVE